MTEQLLAGKLLTIKVKARLNHHAPDVERGVVAFQGLSPRTTKRVRVGEIFEIPANPYKKTKTHMKGVHDTDKRTERDGDVREAQCVFMANNRGWTPEMCKAYTRFQYFDPEAMELVDPSILEDGEGGTGGAAGNASTELPNDYLLKLDEKAAIKAIRKQESVETLEAWKAAEATNEAPRTKIVKAIDDAIEELS